MFSEGYRLFVKSCRAACDDSPSRQFIYTTGATSIRLTNTDLCVEFGPGLGKSGTPLKLEKCRTKGAPGQRLSFTEDNHVTVEKGPGQCADVKDGDVADGWGKLQSWRCASDNPNQASLTCLHRSGDIVAEAVIYLVADLYSSTQSLYRPLASDTSLCLQVLFGFPEEEDPYPAVLVL